MRSPLNSTTVNQGGAFGVRSVPGTGLPDSTGVYRHIGVDLKASIGTKIFAPGDGTVTFVDNSGLMYVEILINNQIHRFLHISKNILSVGQKVSQGQLIAYSGNSGDVSAHLHWDVRKNETTWNQSFYNYVDPMSLLGGEAMPNEGDVHNAYLKANGRRATTEEVRIYTNKPWGAPDGLYYGKTLVDLQNTLNHGATREQLIVEYALAYPNEPLNMEWVKVNTGKNWSDVVNNLRDDPSRQALITRIVNNAAAFENNQSGDYTLVTEQLYKKS